MKLSDMLFANAMMGEGGGGGGGGGGDFEVVTLTLINNSATKYYDASMIWVDEISDTLAYEPFQVSEEETVQVPVVLYKGKAIMYANFADDTIDPIITGDITFNSEEACFEITGAGSIALTGTGEII